MQTREYCAGCHCVFFGHLHDSDRNFGTGTGVTEETATEFLCRTLMFGLNFFRWYECLTGAAFEALAFRAMFAN